MRKFIGIGAGALVEKDGQVEGLGGLVQVEAKRRRATLFEVDGKEIFSTRSKQAKPKVGEKTDRKGGKGQSVRWKAWWRQGNIKCAVSEEYASCWVQYINMYMYICNMYTHAHMYIHIYIFSYIYVSVYIFICIYIYTCIYTCIEKNVHSHTDRRPRNSRSSASCYISLFRYTCVHLHIYIYIYILCITYSRIYMYIKYIHVYIYIYIYYVYTCIYIYVCMYLHIYIHIYITSTDCYAQNGGSGESWCIQIVKNTYMYKDIHVYIYVHTYIYIQTQTFILKLADKANPAAYVYGSVH